MENDMEGGLAEKLHRLLKQWTDDIDPSTLGDEAPRRRIAVMMATLMVVAGRVLGDNSTSEEHLFDGVTTFTGLMHSAALDHLSSRLPPKPEVDEELDDVCLVCEMRQIIVDDVLDFIQDEGSDSDALSAGVTGVVSAAGKIVGALSGKDFERVLAEALSRFEAAARLASTHGIDVGLHEDEAPQDVTLQ